MNHDVGANREDHESEIRLGPTFERFVPTSEPREGARPKSLMVEVAHVLAPSSRATPERVRRVFVTASDQRRTANVGTPTMDHIDNVEVGEVAMPENANELNNDELPSGT